MTHLARLRRRIAVGALAACAIVALGLTAAVHELVTDRASAPGVVMALLIGSLALASVVESVTSLVRRVARHRRLIALVRREAIEEERAVVVFDDPRPLAFCGGLLHPRVFLSTGTRRLLAPAQVEAVLAHEFHHARRRDPLRILLGQALADGLFFLPAARRVAERQAALLDMSADLAAAGDPRSRAALAGAMLATPGGVRPERVDGLLGARPRWDVPRASLAAALTSLSLIAAGAGALLVDEVALRVVFHETPAEPLTALLSAAPLLAGAVGLVTARRLPGLRRSRS